jgi:hypothetical protein
VVVRSGGSGANQIAGRARAADTAPGNSTTVTARQAAIFIRTIRRFWCDPTRFATEHQRDRNELQVTDASP